MDYVIKSKPGDSEAYRIGTTRVSLDSVIHSWLQGDSPETIADNFPVLALEQVYGAIAFYLAHQEEIDQYLQQGEVETEKLKQQLHSSNHALHRKLLKLKAERGDKAA